jgi:hypothetical protein
MQINKSVTLPQIKEIKGRNVTTVRANSGVEFRLHGTPIVRIDFRTGRAVVTLDNGGYNTQSTARWMNHILEEFGIQAHISRIGNRMTASVAGIGENDRAVRRSVPIYDGEPVTFCPMDGLILEALGMVVAL